MPLESIARPAFFNWPRLTASVSVVPFATFLITVPCVPPRLTTPRVVSSYATNAFVALPLESIARPAFFNWLRLTASVLDLPAATFTMRRS
ncbi:hypothetical protein BG61_29350 [Caballeronia glathei]|uniref:Uncharacterized protein n=1 Tax=Caballeronia glathei TaxID=60547 RepID=A0A069Q261_9BURK|nr:hypothetical protein BG61_29350 [Caballeronia glathei]